MLFSHIYWLLSRHRNCIPSWTVYSSTYDQKVKQYNWINGIDIRQSRMKEQPTATHHLGTPPTQQCENSFHAMASKQCPSRREDLPIFTNNYSQRRVEFQDLFGIFRRERSHTPNRKLVDGRHFRVPSIMLLFYLVLF